MTEQDKKRQTIQWIVTGIMLGLGLYNQLAIIKGWAHIEIGDEQLTQYVTWIYELVMGIISFYYNQNISEDAKVSQEVLNALKNCEISSAQVEDLLNNKTVQMVAQALSDGDVTANQVETFLVDPDLQDVAEAQNEGKNIEIKIEE